MLVLKRPTKAELTVKNSRFIAEAIPVETPDDARTIWRGRKSLYDNGGHIVYAFIVGPGANVMGCSDDGEPSGTAGRPMLAVLKGSGLTNLIVTTARWFGGIKLGTGGLVHAYTDCAKAALENAETIELEPMASFDFSIPYSLYEQTKRMLVSLEAHELTEEFADNVRIAGKVHEAAIQPLQTKLSDMTGGGIDFKSSVE